MRSIQFFKALSGEEPCQTWLDQLEQPTRAKVLAYIERVAMGGSLKNIRSLGFGIWEIKIDIGPGYRVYFAQANQNRSIFLLLGGDKKSQSRDIQTAKKYWRQANESR